MKVVLFCGGQGLRMRTSDEESTSLPKPMVPLGSRPILWHLMRYYAHYGHKEFILCLGYKGSVIKEFFASYKEWISNDFVVTGAHIDVLKRDMDDWRITLVDTGIEANIGERLVAVRHYLKDDDVFLANYSDGLTDCPLPAITDQLARTKAIGACMVARPSISMHLINHSPNGLVRDILEPVEANLWINAGFFAFRSQIFDYIHTGEELVLEPFRRLIKEQKLAAYPHQGFWSPCDTFKDLQCLQRLLARGRAPWEVWRDPVVTIPSAEKRRPAYMETH